MTAEGGKSMKALVSQRGANGIQVEIEERGVLLTLSETPEGYLRGSVILQAETGDMVIADFHCEPYGRWETHDFIRWQPPTDDVPK